MVDSKFEPQPETIDEMILENNAMLQIMVHTQARMLQLIEELFDEMYRKKNGMPPPKMGYNFDQRMKGIKEKVESYKKFNSELLQRNIETIKKPPHK